MATADLKGDDFEPELYVARKKVHPKSVKGFYRSMKWTILFITLGVYYLTPWIRWYRGEGAPDQAVLVDLANRRFYFFFIEIWPQEFYYVAGLLVMAGIGLFLVTSTVGRAWCGYFCPQTVWTDLYMWVERRIEGDRNARIRLDDAPMSRSKALKRMSKHAIWVLIAVATGGAWVFYFADAPTLAMQLLLGTAPFEAYAAIAVLTFTTYSLAGLMREQVCIYMCPWPRVQAAMLDKSSLTVTYHEWRGEPRGKHRKSAEAAALGDCIDCNACVAACPTGVDIREGQQLGCITCALCIDACDDIMKRTGRPTGLISYSTLEEYETSAREKRRISTGLWSLLRPRTAIYTVLWAGIGVAMVVSLFLRDRLDVTVQHDRNPQYVLLSDGSVRNGFDLKILNMRIETRLFEITLVGLEDGRLSRAGFDQAPATQLFVSVPQDSVGEHRVFVTLPPGAIEDEYQEFTFRIREMTGTEVAEYEAAFIAPERFGGN